jgi:hypothetical protein
VVVARNFGSDAIYLSPGFDRTARVDLTRKIIQYAEAQEYCGPIFTRGADPHAPDGYAGEIPGTFSQAWFGLLNPARSADLLISFRELTSEDNSKLTGPQTPATVLEGAGLRHETNRSQAVLHPMMGVSYADSGPKVTSGNGTHGALGEYEIHNFGAAIGPDFRGGYVDRAPSSNIDIARTVAILLDVQIDTQQHPTGRLLKEALRNGAQPSGYHRVPLSVTLDLPDQRVVTTIDVDQLGDQQYPIGSIIEHSPGKNNSKK